MTPGRYRYFVLLARMRTGSKVLQEGLGNFAGLESHGELFNPAFIDEDKRTEMFGWTLEDRDRDPIGFLDHVVAKAEGKLPGFRLFGDHDRRVIDHVLRDESCAKIVLWRDPVDSYLSLELARQTGRWFTKGKRLKDNEQVEFSKSGFGKHLRTAQKYYEMIRKTLLDSGQSAVQVAYDDLDRVETYNGIARYLGLDEQLETLDIGNRRQNPSRRIDKVRNYFEMNRILTEMKRETLAQPDFGFHAETEIPGAVGHPSLPVLFLPTGSASAGETSEWVRAHARRMKIKTRGRPMQAWQEWMDQPGRHMAFAVIDHPFPRAYRAFNELIFNVSPNRAEEMLKAFVFAYSPSFPERPLRRNPERQKLEQAGHGVAEHKALFLMFLDFVGRCLGGQTQVQPEPDFATQFHVLNTFSDRVLPERIFRQEELASGLEEIETLFGWPHAPLTDVTGNDLFRLDEIYSAEIESKLREVYATDYMVFGFDVWSSQERA